MAGGSDRRRFRDTDAVVVVEGSDWATLLSRSKSNDCSEAAAAVRAARPTKVADGDFIVL